MENPGKSWKIMENSGKSWKIMEPNNEMCTQPSIVQSVIVNQAQNKSIVVIMPPVEDYFHDFPWFSTINVDKYGQAWTNVDNKDRKMWTIVVKC